MPAITASTGHKQGVMHMRLHPLTAFSWVILAGSVHAQNCPARLPPGSVIPDPVVVSSRNGVLGGAFTAFFDGNPAAGRSGRYCLIYAADANALPVEAPVLRLAPGERVALTLNNRMPVTPVTEVHDWNTALNPPGSGTQPCSARAVMQDFATNLHFHGTNVKPECGSDEVVTTLVLPSASPSAPGWQYDFRLPLNAPPGLDWYHPHVHGLTQEQMLGGMTGALVIDAPNQMPNVVAGLRERILILRDQDPDPAPRGVRYVDRPEVIDNLKLTASARSIFDGAGRPASNDLLNRLLAGRTVPTSDPAAPGANVLPSVVPPWKDLSVNKVELKFSPSETGVAAYTPPGVIAMEGAKEFWRVANVSADSYIRLQVRFNVAGVMTPQQLRVVSMDGVPVSAPNGQLLFEDGSPVLAGAVSTKPNKTIGVNEVLLPPGGRAEFIVAAPAIGQAAELDSLLYETKADSNPFRVLATLAAPPVGSAPSPERVMATPTSSAPRTRFVDNTSPKPKALPDHLLYFSQNDSEFFITEDASTAKGTMAPVEAAFSMRSGPSIYVPNGSVQEWKIENRATEAHAFHMHQIRFRVLKRYPASLTTNSSEKLDEFTLRDTVDLPAYSGTGTPPSVTIRVYFNEPDIRGNFMYHCHILEHEDKGMMGIVRVVDPWAMPVASNGLSAGSGRLAKGVSRRGAAPVAAVSPAPIAALKWITPVTLRSDAATVEAQPVMRDREGRIVDSQICTTPTRAAPKRRASLAALN
jgi:FtsP/CotA-like multicopper oxidase with cupredoxin domain